LALERVLDGFAEGDVKKLEADEQTVLAETARWVLSLLAGSATDCNPANR